MPGDQPTTSLAYSTKDFDPSFSIEQVEKTAPIQNKVELKKGINVDVNFHTEGYFQLNMCNKYF